MKKRSEGVSKYVVVALLLVLSPVGYLLSIGPAAWLRDQGYMSESATQALTIFYQPLSWLAEQSEWFGNAIMFYIALWTNVN